MYAETKKHDRTYVLDLDINLCINMLGAGPVSYLCPQSCSHRACIHHCVLIAAK